MTKCAVGKPKIRDNSGSNTLLQPPKIAPILSYQNDIVLVEETSQEANTKFEEWMTNSGEINGYVTHHTQSNWHKWRAATGVLCDQKLSIRLKDDTVLVEETSQEANTKFEEWMTNSGEINGYVTHHTQSNWHKWRAATGVLCDRKLSIRLKDFHYVNY
ncbi:uncharacterized protein LOC130824957 [Amaranthus tricolor]|uniref:uncharacterized protein LOC130824957 n=1 Tax=Amaranthus tricolor TaxID=29722 RepID=UPI00258C3A18|nr:uncharacterized protein LOC130824957 [Amaranthus tricolor]